MIILCEVTQKDKYHMHQLFNMWNLKQDTVNLSIREKQNQGHREQTGSCQDRVGWEREGLGVWDQQM